MGRCQLVKENLKKLILVYRVTLMIWDIDSIVTMIAYVQSHTGQLDKGVNICLIYQFGDWYLTSYFWLVVIQPRQSIVYSGSNIIY